MSQSPNPSIAQSAFIPGPLKKLFADRHDVRFWQTEGMQHTYLFWVRATLTEEVEPPPFASPLTPHPLPPLLGRTSAPGEGEGGKGDGGEEGEDARRVAYDFLARAWAYPSAETLAAFTAPEFSTAFTEVWTHLTGGALGTEIFAGLAKTDLEQLRAAYTRLFYDTYLPFIPPYESVYSNERQVMGKHAAAVMEFYRRAGLESEGEMPDHIAHECEFIAYLAGEETAAHTTGDDARAAAMRELQDEFLREHLLPWGVKFCADLVCLARDDFYATTARLGTALFNAEWARVSQIVA